MLLQGRIIRATFPPLFEVLGSPKMGGGGGVSDYHRQATGSLLVLGRRVWVPVSIFKGDFLTPLQPFIKHVKQSLGSLDSLIKCLML